MQDLSFQRDAYFDGIRRIVPLAIPGLPFGFVLGVLITNEELPAFAAWASSFIIFAGSSQLAALTLLAEDASAFVVIMSVLLINSRHAMYSAALRHRFSSYPTGLRALMSYVLIDQQFAVTETAEELVAPTPRYRLWHFLGGGSLLWTLWQCTVALGVLVGDVVPESLNLGFAVPLLFIGLLALSVKNSPGVIAAVVGGVAAVLGSGLPQGSGLLLAIVLGVAAAGIAEARQETNRATT